MSKKNKKWIGCQFCTKAELGMPHDLNYYSRTNFIRAENWRIIFNKADNTDYYCCPKCFIKLGADYVDHEIRS